MNSVTALERGLKILDLLIEIEADAIRRKGGVSIQMAASELGVHRSTATRLMQTLVARGYAVPNHPHRGYRLGGAVQTYSGLSHEQQRLTEIAHPFLVRLVELTGECAHLAVAAGSRALVTDDVETGHALRVVSGTGRRVPLHSTSAGKCLLAFGLATIPAELPARTPRTITNPKILQLHLSEIVKQGYAFDDEECHPGVRCISAPVFDDRAAPIACIGIDGPSVRMSLDRVSELAEAVVGIAQELSTRIGVIAPEALTA